MMERTVLAKSSYQSYEGKIVSAHMISAEEKYFRIVLEDAPALDYKPGQFVMIGLPGIGEAPISITSSPTQEGYFDLAIRKVGRLTSVLHRLEAGDKVTIRGPMGNGFPVKTLEGTDLLFVSGGIGIIPLRSLINYVMDNRRDFGKVTILLGCKTPKNFLFEDELNSWQQRADVNYACTVDRGDPDWKGNVGLITTLIPGASIDCASTNAVIVGPPVMYKFVVRELIKKGLCEDHIFMSLERHMKCGLGHCGHCQMGWAYCCKDGPVFSYAEIKNNIEAL
jgi:sulfhydrogenase subunit gamma (sulfur reductase)